ncbi:hypothetical protein GCM10027064_21760 [Microbacterium petrolearium]
MTFETVATETPAARATSVIVIRRPGRGPSAFAVMIPHGSPIGGRRGAAPRHIHAASGIDPTESENVIDND